MNLSISNFNPGFFVRHPSAKGFLFAGILFFLVQLFFLRISDVAQEGSKQIVQYKREWARRDHSADMPQGRKLVVFMGASAMVSGLIPELFDQLNKNRTYSVNLALPALPLAPHYYMLRDYLQNNNKAPDYIIMTLLPGRFRYGYFESYAPQGAGFGEMLELFWHSKNDRLLINYFIPSRLHYREVFGFLWGRIVSLFPDEWRQWNRRAVYRFLQNLETYPHDWDHLYESIFVDPEGFREARLEKIRADRGYYYFVEQAAAGGSLPKKLIAEPKQIVYDENDPFIAKFFRLTKENNIRVLIVSPFRLAFGDKSEKNGVADLWEKVAERYDHVALGPGPGDRYYGPEYFSDPAHVNRLGAERYTKELASEFRQAYGMGLEEIQRG